MCCDMEEGEGVVAYGEWVPVEKAADKATVTSKKAVSNVPSATSTVPSGETASEPGLPDVIEQQPAPVGDNDSVFPETQQQRVLNVPWRSPLPSPDMLLRAMSRKQLFLQNNKNPVFCLVSTCRERRL
ncbi:hypothetical protein GOODEAATRI_029505 [Goodea atripinnis]|uniref:Uncharacterized protein n=1 Tax=Goodea atripinnis TaxID=208336 RepID=A0ABV0P8R6_9TELE